MMMRQNPISIFLSYAHEDEALRRKLEVHLSLLKHQGLISTWHDRQIVAGTNWAGVIDEQLEQASIILLLVSPDFLASDYCYQVEMRCALERHQAGLAQVIPIAMHPADWNGAPFAHLQALPTDARAITTWNNRDEAFVNVIVGLRKAIEEQALLQISTSHTTQPTIWNVPYPRNPFFIGRSDLLQRLRIQFQASQATALSQAQALTGLGGIGKTQIAIEYAYLTRHQYHAVFWIHAESRESLVSGYVSIAEQLKLPKKEMQDPTFIVKAVLHWFTMHTNWLLILDNADDLAVVREFLPTIFSGHILLTTRAQAMGRLTNRIVVDTLDTETGVLFLLRRAGLVSDDTLLERTAASDIVVAREICEELGGLPLALDQAGAYIEETQCSLSQYLERYRVRRAVLLQRRGGLVYDHPQPVATTWSIAFAKVEQMSPSAADLLRLCAFLHPDAIPEELLICGATHLSFLQQPAVSDPFILDEVVHVLSAYSLIRRNAREKTFTMHRLVQAVLKDTLDVGQKRMWIQHVILAVNETFSRAEVISEPQYERYLPHARTCAVFIEQEQLISSEAAHLLYQTGYYLCKHAGGVEAEQLLQRALAIREHLLNAEHSKTVEILNLLGNLYAGRWKYKQAEKYYQRALMIQEQQEGPQHLKLVASLNNLASLYIGPHEYKQSEKYYQRALTIREQALGSDHLDVAESLIDLASVYWRQGKNKLAEPLYKRALTIRERTLGSDHPSVAKIFYFLAAIYKRQGKQEQAAWCDQRVVTLYGEQLKSQYSDTETMINMLVWYYHNVPDTAKQVEELLCHALSIWELQLGPLHLDMIPLLDGLGIIYTTQGKYEQAELLLQRALAIQEQHLGTERLAIVAHLNSLARHYGKRGKYEQAEELYLRELSLRETAYGPDHPDIAPCLNALGEMCEAQGKYKQAEQHWLRAVAIWKQTEGLKSPNAASCHYKLARLYQNQEKYEQAEELYRYAFTIWDRTIRPEYVKEQRKQYASFLRAIGKEEEAKRVETV